ncbi:heterokaryon incompatibility [Fusarium longipes]|uniref:Heterokaryon incompatibility n=1 Tax=Fusarium longipes TaxID=694270 RepID=A0A395T1Z0_9HYPO|nr:heterokaryon incompatibility [Fusarium longipes]
MRRSRQDPHATPDRRKRQRTKPRNRKFEFKKYQPGGSVPYPEEKAPVFNLESVSLALSQGWDPNTSWTEDELVFPPPGSGCVMPSATDPWSHFNTPIHRALYQEQFDVAQLLLHHGADIDQLNASGRTVLHEAIDQGIKWSGQGWTEKAAWIVQRGANVDKKTEDRTVVVTKDSHRGESRQYHRSGGISPIRIAISRRDVAKVQHLAAAGANVNLPFDQDGCWSPLDVAFLRRQFDIVEALENAGASFWTEIENSTCSGDDIAISEASGLYDEESRNLLSFCLSGGPHIPFYPAEHDRSTPSSSCHAVFRSIINTEEFKTAWRQQQGLNDLQHASTLQELERTALDGCPFCRLLLDAVDRSKLIGDNKGNTSPGIESEDTPIMLRVCDTFVGGRLQVRHGDRISNLQISLLEEEFLDYSCERDKGQAGETGSSRALSLSKIWLRRCRESHIDCRQLHDLTDPILPTRVLDVTSGTLDNPRVKLIETNRVKQGTYCALSYCWGKSRCVTTTKANLANHKHDIPLSTLPRTIRDAVLATRGLGIDYLWVDSLCIVQDDTDDWASEAARMGDIYANAMLTISTLSGTDCDDGLFTPHYLRQQYALPFPIPPTANHTVHTQWFVPAVHPPVQDNGFGALQLPFRGPVHSRGWTFQEQMLSTRILWFGHGHVQWECLSKYATDSFPDYRNPGSQSRDDNSEPYGTRRIKQQIQKPFKINDSILLSEQQGHKTGNGESWVEEDRVAAYMKWQSLVAEYTERDLTKDSDRIPAILGLANVMGPMFQCEFFMGIWKGKYFLRSLLWRIKTAATCIASLESSNSYPSWTWASKAGCAIDYSMANKSGGRASSWPTSVVEIDESHVWNGITGAITLKGLMGRLTPDQIETITTRARFSISSVEISMDSDPKDGLPQEQSVWYMNIVKFEHGAPPQGYGYPTFPQGQPESTVCLLLEPADSEEPPRLFRRIGIAEIQSKDLDVVEREVKQGSGNVFIIVYIGDILDLDQPICPQIQEQTAGSGPILMTATIYMILSKIIIALDADIHSLVPVKVMPKVFIFGDFISLAAQLTGAAYLVDATEVTQQRTAQLIIVGGLSFQIYFFGFFTSILHIVNSRVLETPTRQSTVITMPWKRWIIVLYISCGLILVRSLYRVIEYATGPLSIVQATEIYFYIFDAGSIFIITCLFNIFHPRQLSTVSKNDLPDVETIVVTPSKLVSMNLLGGNNITAGYGVLDTNMQLALKKVGLAQPFLFPMF